MKRTKNQQEVLKLTYVALLTALVFVLQFFFSGFRIGTFSVSVVLLPIVLGSALAGPLAGLWLGLVFGAAVLLSGDASLFLSVHIVGTVITVLLKGALAGLVSGAVFRLLSRIHSMLAASVSAVVCPLVNTGVFLIGCRLFFWQAIGEWAIADYGGNAIAFTFLALVGANFFFEVAFNLLLTPAILRILELQNKRTKV